MEICRESIFVSMIRSFCKAFFSVIAIFLALFVISVVYALFSSPFEPEEKTEVVILSDLNDELEVRGFNTPVVLRVNINGIVGEPLKLDSETIETILIDSNRGFLKGRVKAILLYLNTPGGAVVDADNIYRMLKATKEKYKIPIYGYVDGLCASGGMYISCAADKMYANPTSVIGSVGVIMGPFFNFVEGLNKIGVSSQTITQGLDKDMMSPFRPWKPDEDASLRSIMAFFYHRFVDLVAATHPRMNKDLLVSEYGANVFDGPGAVQRGYIDIADAEYKTALGDLMTAANIDPSHPYQVVELRPKFNFFSQISSRAATLFSGKIEHHFNFGAKRPPSIRDQFAYLYEPGVNGQNLHH
jgi:protease-4